MLNKQINYDNPSDTDLYNGSIAQTFWKTANDNTLRGYSYTYDALNRILAADYTAQEEAHYFSVFNILYDKNGNITQLRRNYKDAWNYSQLMDDLTYTYDTVGNKLLSVTDNANEAHKTNGFKDGNTTGNDYSYDANGNLLSDANKNITNIQYNHLNLPTEITFTPSSGLYGGTRKIGYTYDAAGTKLAKSVVTITNTGVGPTGGTTTTYYAGNYIYEKYVGQGPDIVIGQGQHILQFFSTPEGYVKKDNQGFSYVYQYKDHLGNVRLSYADSNSNGVIESETEILSENNYYPGGLNHKGYNNVVSANANSYAEKYKYNSKELQEDLGLGLYDYGARI